MRVVPDPWRTREPSARQEAIEAGKSTYQGKPCYREGHGCERYVRGCGCVQCTKEGRPTPIGGERKPDSYGPLGKAHSAWTELQRQNPEVAPFKLWPRFLNSLQDDPEALDAAIKAIDPPEPPRRNLKNERSRHEGLTEWAERNGVFELEAKVRQAIANGRNGEANRLRNEAMALMRQGSAQVNHRINRGLAQHSSDSFF